MNHTKAILCDLTYSGEKRGHGGEHRSAQIKEILNASQIKCEYLPLQANISNILKYVYGFYCVVRYLKYPDTSTSWRWIRRWGASYYRYRTKLKNYNGYRVLLIENTRPHNHIAFYFAWSKGFKIVAVPQNIECFELLEKEQKIFKIPYNKLKCEVNALKKADVVFCISSEEAWFLAFSGLKTFFLPYYPPSDVIQEMRIVRNKRINNSFKKDYLILGSTTNPYTRTGIISLLEYFKLLPYNNGFKIHIAGSGTEELRHYYNIPFVEYYGKISDEKLCHLLKEVKAMIIYQPRGAGALTRIPEMLIAGVPLVTNYISARSARNYDGIHIFYTYDQLLNLLNKDFSLPEEPPYPELEILTFINYLNGLLS